MISVLRVVAILASDEHEGSCDSWEQQRACCLESLLPVNIRAGRGGYSHGQDYYKSMLTKLAFQGE